MTYKVIAGLFLLCAAAALFVIPPYRSGQNSRTNPTDDPFAQVSADMYLREARSRDELKAMSDAEAVDRTNLEKATSQEERCLEASAPKPQFVMTDHGIELGTPINLEIPKDCK